MKNFVHQGQILSLTAPYAVTSGGGAKVGNIFGVAVNTYAQNDSGEFLVVGVASLAKDSSAFSAGDYVYWDDSAKAATSTVSTNMLIGVAELAAVTGDTTVQVRLNAAFSTTSYPAGTNGQLLIGQTGTDPAFGTVTGDVTINASGVTAIGAKKVLTGMLADTLLHYVEVDISAADIVSTSAGKLSNAQGQTLVAAPTSGHVIELISAALSFTYGTAAFTGGGDVTVNWGAGGAAITGVVSAANSFGATGNKLYQLVPLAAAGNAMVAASALSLVAASAFTQPGTAAGTAKVFVTYRIHTL